MAKELEAYTINVTLPIVLPFGALLTPDPTYALVDFQDLVFSWIWAQGSETVLKGGRPLNPKGLLLFPILIVNIRPVIIVIPNSI